MKRIVLALFLFCGIVAKSQIYTPVVPTTYGVHQNRDKVDSARHIPEKLTPKLNTVDSSAQIFFNKADSSVWAYSKYTGFFRVAGSSAGISSGDTALMLLPYLLKSDSTALTGFTSRGRDRKEIDSLGALITALDVSNKLDKNDSTALTGFTSRGRDRKEIDSLGLLISANTTDISNKLDKNDSTALTGFTSRGRYKKGIDSLGALITSSTVTASKSVTKIVNDVQLVNDSINLIEDRAYASLDNLRGWYNTLRFDFLNPQPYDGIALGADARTLINFNVTSHQNGVVDGLAVNYLFGLTYYVSPGHYWLDGVFHTFLGGNVTLPTADATFTTIDLIGVTDDELADFVQGTPASPALEPTDFDAVAFLPLGFAQVDAGATVPTGQTSVIYYAENLGPTAEGTVATTGATINAAYTFNPAPPTGTKSLRVTAMTTANNIRITRNDTIQNIYDYIYLSYDIKLNNPLTGTNNIGTRLYLGNLGVSQQTLWAGDYGLNRLNLAWQHITVPISRYNFTSAKVNQVRFFMATNTGTKDYQIDNVLFQKGFTPIVYPPTAPQATIVSVKAGDGNIFTSTTPGGEVDIIGANGITTSLSGNVLTAKLGGTLIEETTINAQQHSLVIDSVSVLYFNLSNGGTNQTNIYSDAGGHFLTAATNDTTSSISALIQDGTPSNIYSDMITRTSSNIFQVKTSLNNIQLNSTESIADNHMYIGSDSTVFIHNTSGVQDTLKLFAHLLPYNGGFDKTLVYNSATGQIGIGDGAVGGGGGGGGSPLFPLTGTGTATGSVASDMDGNSFTLSNALNLSLATHGGASTDNDFQLRAVPGESGWKLYSLNGGTWAANFFANEDYNGGVPYWEYSNDGSTFSGVNLNMNGLSYRGDYTFSDPRDIPDLQTVQSLVPIASSFSQVGTATTVFTVTIGSTLANNTYKVNVTPTSALSAALFYVTNKTTTTFDVTYLAGLTGTVTFDWSLNR